jgi:hypothetical protein
MRFAGLALLAALLFIAALVWTGWRSGLLTVRPSDISLRMPEVPALPRTPMPDPQPAPLPRPGPRAEAR